jgi:tripartite-type tricarboxylate transporter receptor subunit TctC
MKRLLAFPILFLFSLGVFSQEYPNRAIHLIVPWPPAGNVDITARAIAPAMSEILGQQVVVENRAGAAGRIGCAEVAKSAPDGYSLVLGSTGTITAGPAVWKNVAYDPLKDFVAVGAIQSVPIVLTAAPKAPFSTYEEFAKLAKEKPGQVTIASAGSGSSNHLALELLMKQAHLQVLHVPYKGSGPAITDVLGSQVNGMMDQLTASIGHIREGRMKALAITTRNRSPLLPDVRTLSELGVQGAEADTFTGIFAPAGLPKAVLEKLSFSIRKALSNPAVRERYKAMGVDVMDMSQPDFAAYVKADLEKWRRVAKEGNISVD